MSLSVVSSEPYALPRSAVNSADCACDIEKTSVVRAYIQAHFANCTIREFHSHSTVRYGSVAVPYADHHVISLSEDRPCCAVLTAEFFEQPVEGLGERLRRWHLASALVAEGTVIVGRDGLSAF
jgi:hypothetical protein